MKRFFIYGLTAIMITGCNYNQVKLPIVTVEKKEIIKEELPSFKIIEIEDIKEDLNQSLILDINTTIEENRDRIAIFFSSSIIGKYGIEVTNSILSYLLFKNRNFEIEVFDSVTHNIDEVTNSFKELISKDYKQVIALVNLEGLNFISNVNGFENLNIYLPLVEKSISNIELDNIIYGAIPYDEQIEYLAGISSGNVGDFFNNSYIGNKLNNILKSSRTLVYSKNIDKIKHDFRGYFKSRKRKLSKLNIFLNASVIDSSIILSQLRAREIKPKKILSTQVNYLPILFSLTQKQDIKNFYIANSIGEVDKKFQAYQELLNNSIKYNWVNYSSLLGIEYLLNDNIPLLSDKIENNEAIYDTKIYKIGNSKFRKLIFR